jgi:hypothetical protein
MNSGIATRNGKEGEKKCYPSANKTKIETLERVADKM